MKKSDNPLLAGIQDLILEKYDLESWPTSGWREGGGEWVDVHVFGEESYIFTVGIVDDRLMIYKPARDSWGYDDSISLYNDNYLEKLWEHIDGIISNITE